LGNPAGGWNADRHYHGDWHGIWPTAAGITARLVTDGREFHGYHGGHGRLSGGSGAGGVLRNHGYRARRVGRRRPFCAPNAWRRDTQLSFDFDFARFARYP